MTKSKWIEKGQAAMEKFRSIQNALVKPDQCRQFARARGYNVLILGETQAGKSTFVQATCHYADPTYTAEKELIGNGFASCTSEVMVYPVITDLPLCQVVKSGDREVSYQPDGRDTLGTTLVEGPPVEYTPYLTAQDGGILSRPAERHSPLASYNDGGVSTSPADYGDSVDEYEDVLNNRHDYALKRHRPLNERIFFNLFDTPGLNDTQGKDEIHVANIFDKIKKAGDIHLVVVMVAQGPFSPGLKAAIQCYLDIFPKFNEIMAFVHTKIDYKDLHPKRTKFQTESNQKLKVIHEIMGRDTFPHFWIDCDLETRKTIRHVLPKTRSERFLKSPS
jgi:GTPase SAR1 family protein